MQRFKIQASAELLTKKKLRLFGELMASIRKKVSEVKKGSSEGKESKGKSPDYLRKRVLSTRGVILLIRI